jgi:hypothetical protein
VRHDNQTGRWITHFEALWVSPSVFVVGNMTRQLDLFAIPTPASAAGKQQRLMKPLSVGLRDDDYMTSIPAVNCVHATRPLVASGNASGKICLWSLSGGK